MTAGISSMRGIFTRSNSLGNHLEYVVHMVQQREMGAGTGIRPWPGMQIEEKTRPCMSPAGGLWSFRAWFKMVY
jgi:hypothetical protein